MVNRSSEFFPEGGVTDEALIFLAKNNELLSSAVEHNKLQLETPFLVFDATEDFLAPPKEIMKMISEVAKTFKTDTFSIYSVDFPMSLRAAMLISSLANDNKDFAVYVDEWNGNGWSWTERWEFKKAE